MTSSSYSQSVTVGRIVRDTLAVFGKNPFLFIGAFIPVFLAVGALLSPFIEITLPLGFRITGLTSGGGPSLFLTLLVVGAIGLVAGGFLQGLLTYRAILLHRGQAKSAGESVGRAIGALHQVVGASVLTSLLASLPILPGAIVLGIALGAHNEPLAELAVLLFVVMLPVSVWIVVGLSLAVPAIVGRLRGMMWGLTWSWEAAHGLRWVLFAAYLVLSVLSAIPIALSAVLLLSLRTWMIGIILLSIFQSISSSLLVIAASVAYDWIRDKVPKTQSVHWAD